MVENKNSMECNWTDRGRSQRLHRFSYSSIVSQFFHWLVKYLTSCHQKTSGLQLLPRTSKVIQVKFLEIIAQKERRTEMDESSLNFRTYYCFTPKLLFCLLFLVSEMQEHGSRWTWAGMNLSCLTCSGTPTIYLWCSPQMSQWRRKVSWWPMPPTFQREYPHFLILKKNILWKKPNHVSNCNHNISNVLHAIDTDCRM